MIFILGSPRTGSTLIYQIMINLYGLFYFTNLTNNYFYKHPFLGSLLSIPFIRASGYESDHGKTVGLFGPSEGSYIFKNWFGFGSKLRPCKKNHIVNTFKRIHSLIHRPIVMKNAWNCFRIQALAGLFPLAKFIWIRRDIEDASYSDLTARYLRGSPYVWNSAPPPNRQEIQGMPYWEQVVEQQYEYNKMVKTDLETFGSDSYIELWYEDLCNDLNEQTSSISSFFNLKNVEAGLPNFEMKEHNADTDFIKIREYVKSNVNKFGGYTK